MSPTMACLSSFSRRLPALVLALLAAPAAFAADGHIDPAGRAHRHSLSIARHAATSFPSSTAPSGLRTATQGIQKCDSQVTADQDVACQVTVDIAGSLGSFGSAGDGLDMILTQADLNSVLGNSAAYAKVVSTIGWCGGPAPSGFTILGCAPVPGSSLVVATMTDSAKMGQVLFHELGHNKGLNHRSNPIQGRPLMAPTADPAFLELNLAECAAFHAGGVDVGPSRPADIGFIVDDTGSMSEEIGGVRDALTRVIDAAAGSGSSCDAFKLTTFKDSVTPRDPTTNLAAIRSQVASLVASGGGACPEASVEAILETEPSLKNNGRAFIFTDASPYDGADLAGAVSRLRARGIRIDALVTGDCLSSIAGESAATVAVSDNGDGNASLALAGSPLSAVEAYSFLAAQTGGSFIFQPGVNSGNPQDATRFENAVYNVVQGAIFQSVSAIEPGKGPRSGQLGITVRGSQTNFLPGSTLSVSGTGVQVYDVTAISPVELRATLSISNTSPLGFRDVEVRTPLGGGAVEVARGLGALEIVASPSGAAVVGISPSVAAQGSTVDVRISGRNTNFGASSLLSLGSGVSVESILSADSDLLRARVRIAANAPVGFRDVRVTTGSQVALENEIGPFFVTSPGPAIARITKVDPNTGSPGTEVTLAIDGENTDFVSGSSRVEIGGDGIEVISQSVASPTRITARIAVASTASQGFRDVRVVTGEEVAAILGGFRVASGGGGACVANDSTLCLGNGRFRVQASWRDFSGNSGTGKVVPGGSADSGIFWFFEASNWELLIKVLDGCSLNDRFWVFAAATTNVEFSISVTDTRTGAAKTYFNPLGHRADSITDTSALDVCGDGAGGAAAESLVSLDRPGDHPGLAVSSEKMDPARFAALTPVEALVAPEAGEPAKSDVKLGLEPGAAAAGRACVTQTISCNSTRTGFLTPDDCALDDGTVFDLFTFDATSGTDIVATLSSADFDTFLFLLDPEPEVVATDDDGGTGTNSRISFRINQTGTWALAPNNFFPGDLGAYSLSLSCSGAPPPLPAAPANLTAAAVSPSRIDLFWTDRSNNETEFRVDMRIGSSGAFTDIGSVPANSIGAQVNDLAPGTAYQFRVKARNAAGSSEYSNIASASTQGGGGGTVCTPGPNTLCLNRSRFKVEVNWKNPEGVRGRGQVAPLGSADSGIFWFFTANNWEMLIKVLDGCGINHRYWVYSAATTTVEYDLVVTDTRTGASRVYSNPPGTPAATILDGEAFATCP